MMVHGTHIYIKRKEAFVQTIRSCQQAEAQEFCTTLALFPRHWPPPNGMERRRCLGAGRFHPSHAAASMPDSGDGFLPRRTPSFFFSRRNGKNAGRVGNSGSKRTSLFRQSRRRVPVLKGDRVFQIALRIENQALVILEPLLERCYVRTRSDVGGEGGEADHLSSFGYRPTSLSS